MRAMILPSLLVATASPLFAQMAPPAPPLGARPMMAMKTMTRAEVQTRVQTQFARRDVNRDGFLTTDELAMRGGGARRMAMRDPNQAFDRLDANRDGVISRDEFTRGREMRIERRVIVQNGVVTQDSARPLGARGGTPGMRRGGGGGMGAGMLKRADLNRDGRVSLAEANSAALQRFDRIDANRDGRITPEERQANRARMMQMRRPG